MNWILQNKKKHGGALLKVLLSVSILGAILFFNVQNSLAANLINGEVPKTGSCLYMLDTNEAKGWRTKQVNNNDECQVICKQNGYSKCAYSDNSKSAGDPTGKTIVNGDESDPIVDAFKKLLIGILNIVGWLFAVAATLFSWVIEPANISGKNGMLNKQAVKDVWIMVRDVLNMTFILVLLFAAFCTIFQYDKWSLKKVWFNVMINALLVNFSYPIARFFIDVSNVAFYYFINNLFTSTGTVTGSSIFASWGASSNLGNLVQPADYANYQVAYLVAMIVVVFIMGMTLMVIAGLFVVRLVALTMLVMFSPVGFVGYIFPSTEKYANKWWDNLFSYSFFAPIMIFIVAISLHISEAMGRENFQSFMSNSVANAPANQANWIANAAFFTIPVIILWTGIGYAKSSGIAMAGTITEGVKKRGKWLATRPWAYSKGVSKYAWKQSGVPGGVKKGMENIRKSGKVLGSDKFAWLLKDNREEHEAQITGGIGGGKKGWDEALEKKKAEEFRKKYKEKADEHDRVDAIGHNGLTYQILNADLHNADANKRAGEAMKVASMLHALKTDSGKKDEFELKLKESIQTTHATHLANLANDGERDVFIKKEMAKNWKILNAKGKQAHAVATKGSLAATDPVIDRAYATTGGAVDTWS